MKKQFYLTALLTVLVLCCALFVGCNSDDAHNTDTTSETTAAQSDSSESTTETESESATGEQTDDIEEGLRPGEDSPDGWGSFDTM